MKTFYLIGTLSLQIACGAAVDDDPWRSTHRCEVAEEEPEEHQEVAAAEEELEDERDIPLCPGEDPSKLGQRPQLCQTLVYNPETGYCNRWRFC